MQINKTYDQALKIENKVSHIAEYLRARHSKSATLDGDHHLERDCATICIYIARLGTSWWVIELNHDLLSLSTMKSSLSIYR